MAVEVVGAKELVAKLCQISEDLTGPPMIDAMRKSTLLVTRTARQRAPIDRGGLRASIMPEVVIETKKVIGIVGSNKIHAPAQELGTKPYWAPLQPLINWVRRKGMATGNAIYAVAKGVQRAIARRGIIPKEFLKKGLEENTERIINILDQAVTRIIKK